MQFCKNAWLAIVLFPSLALAHAQLEEALPPVGGTVVTAPAELRLEFSEALEAEFTKVVVTNGHGDSVNAGPIHTDPARGTNLLVPVRPLPAGDYTVSWRAVSVDTHKTQGTYHFTVAP